MMRFKNRELAEKLDLNFQKWRRWSREFDPGNTPRGYEREYSFGEAFKVYLGGHLVSQMGYKITDAKQILSDLDQWLTENDFYSSIEQPIVKKYPKAQFWTIGISPIDGGGFHYLLKGTVSMGITDGERPPAIVEKYYENPIMSDKNGSARVNEAMMMFLNLSLIRNFFMIRLGLVVTVASVERNVEY